MWKYGSLKTKQASEFLVCCLSSDVYGWIRLRKHLSNTFQTVGFRFGFYCKCSIPLPTVITKEASVFIWFLSFAFWCFVFFVFSSDFGFPPSDLIPAAAERFEFYPPRRTGLFFVIWFLMLSPAS